MNKAVGPCSSKDFFFKGGLGVSSMHYQHHNGEQRGRFSFFKFGSTFSPHEKVVRLRRRVCANFEPHKILNHQKGSIVKLYKHRESIVIFCS